MHIPITPKKQRPQARNPHTRRSWHLGTLEDSSGNLQGAQGANGGLLGFLEKPRRFRQGAKKPRFMGARGSTDRRFLRRLTKLALATIRN
jgi:hypothetical protein